MSVATKNPFALLDAEDSSRPSSPAPTKPSAPQAAAAPTRDTQKSRGGPASRGGKYYPRGGARSAPKDPSQPQTEEPVTENQRKFDGRGRGRGRGGAARGGRGRPFDRHSQTGKTDSDKKMHQGWGGDEGNTELKAEEAAANDAAAEAIPESSAEGPEPAAEAQPEDRSRKEREPEEDDSTLTFDQYLAQKKEKESSLPKLETTREANEGNNSLWKDAVPLSKNDDEQAYFVGKTKSTPKARAKKEEKKFIEIDGRFDRPDRGGRGRGRGGDRGRGGRGRGGPRGGPRQNGGTAPSFDVDDQTAFPSLA